MTVGRWVPLVSLVLAAFGVAVSTYLTIAHLTTPAVLVCSASGAINCEKVTTSAQSTFVGIPVAMLGLGWFLAMAVLCLPAAWRSSSPLWHASRLTAAIAGIAFTLWLVYAELFIIGAICLWCTIVHLLAFGLFVVAVVTAPGRIPARDEET